MAKLVTLPGSNHKFAAGLSWRHEDAEPSYKALRVLLAGKGQWGIVRKTKTGTFQVGFCAAIPDASSAANTKALAAVIADQKPQPWMGIYQVGEKEFWYVAVRDDQEVIPGGDFIGTRDEVDALRNTHLGYGEWNEVEGTIEDLAEMAMAVPRPTSLYDFQARKIGQKELVIGGTVLAVLIASVSWSIYAHYKKAQLEATQRRDQALADMAAKEKRSAEARILPWTKEPMPSSAFASCRQAWETQSLAIKGWPLQNWTCHVDAQNTAVTASWQRQGGLAADAPGILLGDAEHSTSTRVLPVAFQPSSPKAGSTDLAQRSMWTLAQSYGIKLTYSPAPPAPTPLPGSDASKEPVDPWTSAGATFSLDAPPWVWLEQPFDNVAGLRVRDITWNADTQIWLVSGVMFAFRNTLSIPERPTLNNLVGTRS